jgi:flagellar motility protein MotE (MotC chaperone)
VCATSIDQLAQQAGMSANELQILQSLGKRRAELDQREAQLNTRGQLIEAADSKLDARIAQLSDLKTQIQGLLDQATKVQDDDATRLVAVYSAMKPKDAAAVLTSMSDDVRLPLAAKLKDRALASILGAMTPDAARELTEKLAKRMQKADGLQQQLDKTAAGGTASSAPPAKGAPAAKPTPAKGK